MYAEVPEKNVNSSMDRIEEGDVTMTPAAPLTPSSNLAGNSSNPSASVGVSPEGRTPVPVLSSPPSVTKPAVIGGVAFEIKPKSQGVLFKDKSENSAKNALPDPTDDGLVNQGGEDLVFHGSFVVSWLYFLHLMLSDEKNNAKRSEPSVPVIAPLSAGKKGRKK